VSAGSDGQLSERSRFAGRWPRDLAARPPFAYSHSQRRPLQPKRRETRGGGREKNGREHVRVTKRLITVCTQERHLNLKQPLVSLYPSLTIAADARGANL
jgi:hypothetical protein